MALSDRQVRLLVTRYQVLNAELGSRTARDLASLWLTVGPSFDEDDRFAAEAAPILAPAKRSAVRLASGLYTVLLEARSTAIDPDLVTVPDRLREPFIAFWRAINSGADEPDALASGVARAEAVARDFVTSTGRRTGDQVAAQRGLYGQWRRMTDGNACDWCRGMTVHVWDSAEAADFGHDRCGCTPVPAWE